MENIENIKHKPKIIYSNKRHGRTQTSVSDFKETPTREKWISLGKKNDAPQELIRLYESASSYHRNLINKRTKMIANQGFDFTKIIGPEALIFFNNQYGEGNLNKITKSLAANISMFGGGYLLIRFEMPDANGYRRIGAIDCIPFEKVRPEKQVCDGTINWYVSRDWLKLKDKENEPVWFAGFDAEDAEHIDQILPVFLEECMIGRDYCPLPIYNAALDEIKTLYELGVFNLNSVKKGFTVEHIFIHPGQYSDDQQAEIVDNIDSNYSGTDNAGSSMHIFPGTVIPGVETQVIPVQRPDSDKRYLELRDQLTQEVISAHGATSPVAGKESNGIWTKDEIADAYEYFQLSEINDNQKTIEDAINMLAKLNGVTTSEFKLNKFNYKNATTNNTTNNTQA